MNNERAMKRREYTFFIKRFRSIGVNGKGKSARNQEMCSLISRIPSKSAIPRSVVVSPERGKALRTVW